MHEDRYGLRISTASATAAAHYREATDLLLSAWPGALEEFDRAIAADPEFALAHLGRARVLQMTARIAQAQAAAALARAYALSSTGREQAQIGIISMLLDGNAPAALGGAEVHLREYPRDALILSLLLGAFGLYAFSGRPDHDAARVRLCESLTAHYPGDWWFTGYLGWSLTEAGRLDEGLRHTERALDIRPRNANAAHALAHARFDRGEIAEGRRFLEGFLPGYDRSGLLNGHIGWHLALFALEQGDSATAHAVYEERLRPEVSTAPPLNTMTDAVSLLWRFTLRGEALPGNDVAAYGRARFGQPGLAFADLHMAMLEAMSGQASALALRIERLDVMLAEDRLAAGSVVPALCRGIAAFAAGADAEAADILVPLLPEVVRIGGSGAQRDMVTDTAIAACLRAGRNADAQAILRRRMMAH